MIRWDRVKKLRINSDLADGGIESACAEMSKEFDDTPKFIVCQMSATEYAKDLASKYGLTFYYLPDKIMKQDSWALVGHNSMIWSPGV